MSWLNKLHDVLNVVVKVAQPVDKILAIAYPPAGTVIKLVIDSIISAESLFPDGNGDLKNKLVVATVQRDAEAQGLQLDPIQLSTLVTQLVTVLNAQQSPKK